MSTLSLHPTEKEQHGGERKYRWSYYLLTLGLDGKDTFPGGVLPGCPPLPEGKREKKIDLILYYLSCFSGSKLILYLATENLNPSSFGAELLSAKNSPEGRKNSEFLNF